MPYTKDEAYQASLEFFKGDELAANVFVDKYALKDSNSNFYELTPIDMWHRLTKEIHRIEQKYPNPLTYEEIYDCLEDFKVLPGGSILFGIGNSYTITSSSNCFAIEKPEDNMSGIFNAARSIANLSKRRGGVGVCISSLRPDGATVNNAAKTSSGAWRWGKFLAKSAEEVGQESRRAALIEAMHVWHPDIAKFITMKQNTGDATGVNISVYITDAFMRAVKEDLDWDLTFNGKTYNTVKARYIWDLIAECAANTGEPGLLNYDIYANNVPLHHYPGYEMCVTNPCLSSDAKVLTPSGCKTIAEVNIGDIIWSTHAWTKVINKQSAGLKDVYKYCTSDNNKFFLGTTNHNVVSNGKKIPIDDAKCVDAFIDLDDNINVTQKLNIISKLFVSTEEVWDITVDNESHTFWCNGLNVSNCGELMLSANASCNLTSNTLNRFVVNPYTDEAYFDIARYSAYVAKGVRLLDDFIDLELEALDKIIAAADTQDEQELFVKIRHMCEQTRRVGLGTLALADVFVALGIRYDSSEALDLVDRIYFIRMMSAYSSSVDLAEERGAFPAYNYEYDKKCPFIQRLPEYIKEKMVKVGRRNGALLTDPPTGSVAQLAQSSTGIEPIFDIEYTRRRKLSESSDNADFTDANGIKYEHYKVFHKSASDYMAMHNLSSTDQLPDYFVIANDLDWKNRVKLQGIISRASDGGVSSTVNLPKGTKADVVKSIYELAYNEQVKGITVYVDGSRDGVLIKEDNACAQLRNDWYHRPETLPCEIHRVSCEHHKETHNHTIIVSLRDGQPYELFGGFTEEIDIPKDIESGIIKKHKNKTKNRYELIYEDGKISNLGEAFNSGEFATINRLISGLLRNRAGTSYTADQLQKDPSSSMFAYAKVVSRVLKKYAEDGSKSNNACPSCGEKALRYEGGCVVCSHCGFSGCS